MAGWLALAALMVLIGGAAGAPGLFLVAAATIGYGSLSRVWSRYGMGGVEYERSLGTGRAIVGDTVPLDVTIWNRKPLPLPWIAAEDLVTDGIGVRERPSMDWDDERLGRRVLATRWPDRETVSDQSQGIRLAQLRELVRYWGTSYDWRKIEARVNALPQFMTTIDGVDIHFIHVRSRHPGALPVIITHGWPGSVFEQLKLIGPLTDPTAHGGRAEDAFDVVIPSMPGYGFSGKPTEPGWGVDHIARVWAELMTRLGYTGYVAQGGDWGSPVSSAMARQASAGLLGIHINLPATVPPEAQAAYDATSAKFALAGGYYLIQTSDITYDMVAVSDARSWISWFYPF